MGMKSTVRSMQRGALMRSDEAPITNADLYKASPPLLTDDELAHFKFGNRSINDFFLGVSDVLKACHHSHLAAAEVAKVLNKKKSRTACGETWTPRLAWFLMKTWRTVHYQKMKNERQAEKIANRRNGRSSVALEAESGEKRHKSSPVSQDIFQKVLRNYFKNPTLGEMFPELGLLKKAMLDKEASGLAGQSKDTIVLATVSDAVPTPEHTPTETPKRRRPKPRKKALLAVPLAVSDPIEFTGGWKEFFLSKAGQAYLSALVRSNSRLLELSQEDDIRFLGCLRAKKAPHPRNEYWTERDAEQIRLAIRAGIHR